MKTILVVALLLCAGTAQADTVNCGPSDCTGPVTYTQLNGAVKSPGDTFTYDFFVEPSPITARVKRSLTEAFSPKAKTRD